MADKTKIKLRRVLNELRYLYEELGFIEDICKGGATDFDSYYKKYCAENDIDIKKLNKEHAERIQKAYGVEPSQEPETPSDVPHSGTTDISTFLEVPEKEFTPDDDEKFKEMHVMFNKIFKKLALRLHPDRIDNYILDNNEKFKLKNDFSNARRFLEKKAYSRLLDVAKKYDIYATENLELQVLWFQKERNNIRKHISEQKLTYNYVFAECESDKKKDNLIKDFLHQLFGLRV